VCGVLEGLQFELLWYIMIVCIPSYGSFSEWHQIVSKFSCLVTENVHTVAAGLCVPCERSIYFNLRDCYRYFFPINQLSLCIQLYCLFVDMIVLVHYDCCQNCVS
jgi:hypothetical protein